MELFLTRSSQNTRIEPVKNGNKFKSWNWTHAAQDTAVLAETCRQMYVDCVGGGLLYRYQNFRFNSATAMINYLWVINPIHKEALRSISLKSHIGAYNWSVPKKSIVRSREPLCSEGKRLITILQVLLAECKGLNSLTLEFSIDRFKCTDRDFPNFFSRSSYLHDYRGHYNWRRVPWNVGPNPIP